MKTLILWVISGVVGKALAIILPLERILMALFSAPMNKSDPFASIHMANAYGTSVSIELALCVVTTFYAIKAIKHAMFDSY
jgi:fumarate reductase subunit D